VRRKLDEATTKSFRGGQLYIRVPAATPMQVDGSVVKLDDYLRKGERDALRQRDNASEVMVSYQFDAVPGAVRMAVPCTYNGMLFQTATHTGPGQGPVQTLDMVDKSTDPFQIHFGPVFGEEAV
jgi:hypothetical protein